MTFHVGEYTAGEGRGQEPGWETGPSDVSAGAPSKTRGASVQCPAAAHLQLQALCMYSTACFVITALQNTLQSQCICGGKLYTQSDVNKQSCCM